MAVLSSKKKGFSLVDTMVGAFVMGLVIAGGLTGLGQATLLSGKSRSQANADFILRAEIELMRSLEWAELEALADTVDDYMNSNGGKEYPNFQTMPEAELAASGYSGKVKADALQQSGQAGKVIFHLTLEWSDRTGKTHEESRVMIFAEGGLSG